MIGGILLIALVIFGLSWLFGFGKPERLIKFIVWLVFGPLLLGLFYSEWYAYYSELSWFGQVAIIVAIPFLLLLALRSLFPQSKLVAATTGVIWDILVFSLTFPFRLVWRSGRQIANKEGNRIKLARYRPAIGGRPPLMASKRPSGSVNRD